MWGWKFMSPFFSEVTHSKISFYGNGNDAKEQWRNALFTNLPERVIPSQYGGSSTPISIHDDLDTLWEEFCMQEEDANGDKSLSLSD